MQQPRGNTETEVLEESIQQGGEPAWEQHVPRDKLGSKSQSATALCKLLGNSFSVQIPGFGLGMNLNQGCQTPWALDWIHQQLWWVWGQTAVQVWGQQQHGKQWLHLHSPLLQLEPLPLTAMSIQVRGPEILQQDMPPAPGGLPDCRRAGYNGSTGPMFDAPGLN